MSDIAVDSQADPINRDDTVVEGVNDGTQVTSEATADNQAEAPKAEGILGDVQKLGQSEPEQKADAQTQDTKQSDKVELQNGNLPEDWKKTLDPNISKEHEKTLKNMPNNINSIVKAYAHLEKIRGQKTVSSVPDKEQSPEKYREWLETEMGVPKTVEEYENEAIDVPENLQPYFGELDDKRSQFRNDCHELGISKEQHAALESRYLDREIDSIANAIKEQEQANEVRAGEIKEQMQRKMGMGYEPFLRDMQKSIGFLQGKVDFDVYKEYGADERFPHIMAAFSQFLTEDKGAPQGGLHNIHQSTADQVAQFKKENWDSLYGARKDSNKINQLKELERQNFYDKRNQARR